MSGKVLTKFEVVEALDALTDGDDQEIAHGNADALLVSYLRYIGHTEVAEAYERAKHRVGFWYA